jgi:hypothetical protein
MRPTIRRCSLLAMPLLACAATLLPLTSQARSFSPGPPVASTGSVSHVRGSAATLNGTVQPHGLTTSYYFEYGPTVSYGTLSATGTLPPGYTAIRVAETVIGLRLGEHFRLVAKNSSGSSFGRDHTYAPRAEVLTIAVPSGRGQPPTPYGGTYVLHGTISSSAGAFHKVELQASTYPYLEPFAPVGEPATTSATGSFVLRAPHLTASTQFRAATLDPRPFISGVVNARVSVRVTFKVRASSRRGFVRLYGTVTPAEVGVRVAFQVLKAIRPGRNEVETAFGTQFGTTTKRATHSMSRFSLITTVHRSGQYRALVELHKGALDSGTSSTIYLKAAPPKAKRRR